MKNTLADLEPKLVWHFFEEICAIPHGSGQEEKISLYLEGFAKKKGLACRRDEKNNVIIFAPGTPGYENHPTVILQGHMDMVCEKEPDCPINFETDSLDVAHDGKAVFARGTTLGGDDGIALAYGLALLEDETLVHPPLELLFTTDEEVGMLGAETVDLSDLKGRTMINLDSEEEGILTVSCAGGATAALTLPVSRRAVYGPCWALTVSNLQGGHSGQEINCGRANANIALGQLLARILEKLPFRLAKITGGNKDNAIPRSARAMLVSMSLDEESLPRLAAEFQAELRERYQEPEATVTAERVEAMGGLAMTAEDTEKALSLLTSLPNGVQSMSEMIPNLVQTSLNLGIAAMEGESLKLTVSVRSSLSQEKEALLARLREEVENRGGSFQVSGDYPAWEYREESPLRDLMDGVYQEMFGTAPKIQAIHAGLECGLLAEKLPGLDCVSMGPDMTDIHTTRERLDIGSVGRMWDYLLELLRRL